VTVSQKAALSLLISVVLVAGFSILAFTGFFNLVETRFYNPSITGSLRRDLERDAESIQNFLDELEERFSAALENEAVIRSFLPNQTAQDIFERTRLFGILLESQKGLQSVRFVDTGGGRLHFSTDPADILTQNNETITYKNYEETIPYVPFNELAVPSGGNAKITLDEQNDRIVFSFPFYDSMEVYRGTVLYSLSIRAVSERLIIEGRIKIGEDLSLVSVPPGMVSALPVSGRNTILPIISSVWHEGLLDLTALDSQSSPSALALISTKTEKGLFIGRVVDEALFAFPDAMKVILLVAIFLTIFLSIFLGFNLRPDTLTVIQNRLKGLQLSLIREYYERKGEMDWNHWYKELEQRREDVRTELKRGIKEKTAPALLEDIDSLIDKSWDEILTAIGGKRETRLAIDEDKLQNILNRMLMAAGNSPVLPGGGQPTAVMPLVPPANVPAAQSTEEAAEEEPEEIAVLEDAEDIENVRTGDKTADTELFELEELSDADELEELSPDEEELPEAEAAAVPNGESGMENAVPPDQQKSNIQLVFGNDDIPTIVESSGLELVDEVGLDSETGDEAELEELSEDLEELESVPTSVEIPIGETDIASKIEFSDSLDEDEGDDLDKDFVIVSPFTNLLSKFDDKGRFKQGIDEDSKQVKTSGRLEELNADYSVSLVHKPFQSEDQSEPEELYPVSPGIITKKNGVNYVDKKVKTPDDKIAKNLDPGLKNLVDSVIGKK
jgi:hypothetical protein